MDDARQPFEPGEIDACKALGCRTEVGQPRPLVAKKGLSEPFRGKRGMPEDQVLLNQHSHALVEGIRPGEILEEVQVFICNAIQDAMRVEKNGNVDAADHLAGERGIIG